MAKTVIPSPPAGGEGPLF